MRLGRYVFVVVSRNTILCLQIYCRLSGDKPKKSHFVVRISVGFPDEEDEEGALLVQTEDYLLTGYVMVQDEMPTTTVNELGEKIKKKGLEGNTGYFYAFIPKQGLTREDGADVIEIKINIPEILPVEVW